MSHDVTSVSLPAISGGVGGDGVGGGMRGGDEEAARAPAPGTVVRGMVSCVGGARAKACGGACGGAKRGVGEEEAHLCYLRRRRSRPLPPRWGHWRG